MVPLEKNCFNGTLPKLFPQPNKGINVGFIQSNQGDLDLHGDEG